jgi:hypothetical protein
MNHKKRIASTDLANLVSNLRGEVGEIIVTSIIMRHFIAEGARRSTEVLDDDMKNSSLSFINLLADKLRDELVGRLAELSYKKVGRLNFYFAVQKLGKFEADARAFGTYIKKTGIHEKRNYDISHKELPEQWNEHRYLRISYRVLLRGLAMAVRLMKRIDREVVGVSAKYFWYEARKRRYKFTALQPRVAYMLLPYIVLPDDVRLKISEEQERAVATHSC